MGCRSNQVIAPKGRYVTVCGDFESDTQISCCLMCGVMCGVLGRKMMGCCCSKQEYHMVNQQRSMNIEDCVQLIVDGKVKPLVDEDSPYPLDEYLTCFEKCLTRTAHGKLLLQITEEEERNERGIDVGETGGDVVVEEEEKHDTVDPA